MNRKELLNSKSLRVLGLLLLTLSSSCAATPEPVLPSSIVPLPSETATFTKTPEPTSTFTATFTPIPSNTPTPTPTEGVFENWPDLQAPTIAAMAAEIADTMDANPHQIELAEKELPQWYMQNVVSIVFRDDLAEGYTGLRIDASSFVDADVYNPGLEYYLLVNHADASQKKKRNVTIKDTNNDQIVVQKNNWEFASDISGMAILAIKTDHPVPGVSKNQFLDMDEWDQLQYAAGNSHLKGLCFPYPDNLHHFQPWFFSQSLNSHPTIRYEGTWQLATKGITAEAASGCPLVSEDGQKVLALAEGIYSEGALLFPINKKSIGDLISSIQSSIDHLFAKALQ